MHQNLSLTQSVTAGLKSLPNIGEAFAATQAAWQFYCNERVKLPLLAEPILAHEREASVSLFSSYCLVMHDFSALSFSFHESKEDRISLYRSSELGYFLQSALPVSNLSGSPIAPLYLELEASDEIH